MFVVVYLLFLVISAGILSLKSSKGDSLGKSKILVVSLLMSSLSPLLDYWGLYSNDRSINAVHFSFYYTRHLTDPLSVALDGFQEPGWAMFNMAFRLFTDNFGIVLFVISFLYNASSLALIKALNQRRYIDTRSLISTSIIFLCSIGPLYALSQSSQFLALAICNVSFIALVKMGKKALRLPAFLFLIILACSVHTSAIVMPILVLLGVKIVKTGARAVSFLILGLVAAVSAVHILPLLASVVPFLQQTMTSSFAAQSQGVLIVLKSVPFLLIAIDALVRQKAGKNKTEKEFWTLWVFVACSCLSFVAAVGNYWFWRLAMFGLIPFASMASCEKLTSKYSRLQLFSIAIQIAITIREAAILYPIN